MSKKLMAEALGTLILVLFGCGAAVIAGLTDAERDAMRAVVERLRGDRVKSELTLLLAAAVAAADDHIVPQEQAVIDALYDAFELGRPLADADLARALAAMTPQSRSGDGLAGLRAWAAQHARPASRREATAVALPLADAPWAIEAPA